MRSGINSLLAPDPGRGLEAPASAGADLSLRDGPDAACAALVESADAVYMRLALAAAEQAARSGEVPVGAVVVKQNQVLAVAHNERETGHDPTAHAEIVALRRAARALGSWRLIGAELYVTMEPCPMCAGALVNARITRVHYGCHDPKAGAVRTLYQILDDSRLNHRVEVNAGLMADESAALLKSFFARLRVPAAPSRR